MKAITTPPAKTTAEQYREALDELKLKHVREFEDLRNVYKEKLINEVNEKYKKFSWRGNIAFAQLKSPGSCIFNGFESCQTIHLTNDGFIFSGNMSKNIPLIKLPTLTIGLLSALIRYMENNGYKK